MALGYNSGSKLGRGAIALPPGFGKYLKKNKFPLTPSP